MAKTLELQKINSDIIDEFQIKAQILDEFLELLEDKYLGYLMKATEKEPNINLAKARHLLK